jgi:hypothetical protein
MKVFIYRNLRKKCYSVKALEGPNKGRVIAHANTLTLTDCQFKVSPSGRERVRRTGHKTVHAGVVGQWDGGIDTAMPSECKRTLYYNPHKVDTFVHYLTYQPIAAAPKVYLGLTGVFAQTSDSEDAAQVSE